MITIEDIQKAEEVAEQARERSARLRRTHGIDGGEAVERERQRVEELRQRKERQDAAIEARKAVEKPHRAELTKMAKTLDGQDGEVVKAVEELRAAHARLLAVVADRNGATGSAHARLLELGLVAGDEAVSEYDTGCGPDGLVRIAGRVWGPVAADVVTTAAVAAVAAAEYGRGHALAQAVHNSRQHVLSQSAPARELLGRLPGGESV